MRQERFKVLDRAEAHAMYARLGQALGEAISAGQGEQECVNVGLAGLLKSSALYCQHLLALLSSCWSA